MPESYPYIISNNKIEPILGRIRSAAKPERFNTRETLATWGFTASNDRAMVAVLKALGFLNESGNPTEYYDRLRDPNDWRYVLGERVRALYTDLFAIDAAMNTAPEAEVKGAMLRITGKDEEAVARYYATFKTLVGLARFDPRPAKPAQVQPPEKSAPPRPEPDMPTVHTHPPRHSDFHYNIQIHLPVTTDITVYNAIFKSLKESLGIQ